MTADAIVRGYRGVVRDVAAVLAAARAAAEANAAVIQLVRADRVYGAEHLQRAASLARRAVEEGRARATDIGAEVVLRAAGERQIGRALTVMGLRSGVDGIAAVAWGAGAGASVALDALASAQGWTRDDGVLEGDESVLVALGITEVERNVVPREKWPDLVLERVALVDVLKA